MSKKKMTGAASAARAGMPRPSKEAELAELQRAAAYVTGGRGVRRRIEKQDADAARREYSCRQHQPPWRLALRAKYKAALDCLCQHCLCRCQSSNRNPKRRTGYIIHPDLLAILYTAWITAVFAANPHLQLRSSLAAQLDTHAHQPTATILVKILERIGIIQTLPNIIV